MEITALIVALIALVASVWSYWISNRNSIVQVTHAMHSALFGTPESFSVLYDESLKPRFYFSVALRGKSGNFLGSKHETSVDLFLENLNFLCFWLLKRGGMSLFRWMVVRSFGSSGGEADNLRQRSIGWSSDERKLFDPYIQHIYENRFFREYFSFLDSVARETALQRARTTQEGGTSDHFVFLHRYAADVLHLKRPSISFARNPSELETAQRSAKANTSTVGPAITPNPRR